MNLYIYIYIVTHNSYDNLYIILPISITCAITNHLISGDALRRLLFLDHDRGVLRSSEEAAESFWLVVIGMNAPN